MATETGYTAINSARSPGQCPKSAWPYLLQFWRKKWTGGILPPLSGIRVKLHCQFRVRHSCVNELAPCQSLVRLVGKSSRKEDVWVDRQMTAIRSLISITERVTTAVDCHSHVYSRFTLSEDIRAGSYSEDYETVCGFLLIPGRGQYVASVVEVRGLHFKCNLLQLQVTEKKYQVIFEVTFNN